jgi:hypothetical protein
MLDTAERYSSSSIETMLDTAERYVSIMRGGERTVATIQPSGILAMAEEHGKQKSSSGVGNSLWAYNRQTDEMIDVSETGSRRASYAFDNRKIKNNSKMMAKAEGARQNAREALEKRRLAKGGAGG